MGSDQEFKKHRRHVIWASKKAGKIFQVLRLSKINNGTFVKLNKASINMLRRIEPFIAYGYPNRKIVKDLIYKRGFGKVGCNRIALTDNSIIESALGNYGIICIEDLIHEIFSVGSHFKVSNNFLLPFHLSSPLGGFTLKRCHYIVGGETGNHEENINKLLKNM